MRALTFATAQVKAGHDSKVMALAAQSTTTNKTRERRVNGRTMGLDGPSRKGESARATIDHPNVYARFRTSRAGHAENQPKYL
jgi:hypothetical protein